jgi:hypothetical protein
VPIHVRIQQVTTQAATVCKMHRRPVFQTEVGASQSGENRVVTLDTQREILFVFSDVPNVRLIQVLPR